MRASALAIVAALITVALAHEASAQSCKVPGFTDAAFGDIGVTLTGNSCTDSYDSSLPPNTYAGTQCTTLGATCVGGVGTNGTGNGAITLSGSNACVNGACEIGFGGSTSSISGGTKCSSQTTESSTVELDYVTAPTFPAATPFDISSPAIMTPDQTYGDVTGSGSSTNTISLSAGTYVMSSLKLSGSSSLVITSGPVYVYITGSGSAVDLSGNGVNNTTGVATNLIFMCTDSVTSASIVGNGTTSFGFYCPRAAVSVTGNGDVYGAIVGRTVNFNGNGTVHYDKALGSVTSGQLSCAIPTEVSRATPILASLTPSYGGNAQDVIVQGSYETANGLPRTILATTDIASWTFPYIKGHLRARLASSISSTASSFKATVCTSSGTPAGCSALFDAGATGNIPAMGTFTGAGCSSASGTCRYVFTNTNATSTTGVTRMPTTRAFNANNSSTIGPLIASTADVSGITLAQQQLIMQKVLQASLGGVDRSTAAVIGPSAIAGTGTRPAMAYFGATDGMLHAVCASSTSSGPCAGRLGTELWAFMPRVELPLLRSNTTRIDGSPHVLDAFGDFDGDGTAGWSTILIFQTGYSRNTTPATYALDITDPTSPSVIWERTTPSTSSSVAFGTGLAVASGRVGAAVAANALLVTNNGGTGGPGVVATSVSIETGATVWAFSYLYPGSPRSVSADGPLSSTAIPGGAVGVDLAAAKSTTDFILGDIYGNLWRLDASTGASKNGTGSPLFSFTTNKHPIGAVPAIYSNGSQQFAVFASGGYVDQAGSATWRATTQYVIAVRLDSTATTPANENTTTCATCAVSFKSTLTNAYGFAQALVVGAQLFITVDSGDVNASTYGSTVNTGTLTTFDLAARTSTTTVVSAGGGGLASVGTAVLSSSGQKQQLVSNATTTAGNTVDVAMSTSMSRLLWLRYD